jgi:hypothetical protein
MIICLGPICFPIWQLFPVLVLLLAKAKAVYYWMIGKPMPVEDGDKKKVDGPNEAKVADAGDSSASSAETLRQRRAGGVTSVKSVEDWHSLVKVCVPFRSALPLSLKTTEIGHWRWRPTHSAAVHAAQPTRSRAATIQPGAWPLCSAPFPS